MLAGIIISSIVNKNIPDSVSRHYYRNSPKNFSVFCLHLCSCLLSTQFLRFPMPCQLYGYFIGFKLGVIMWKFINFKELKCECLLACGLRTTLWLSYTLYDGVWKENVCFVHMPIKWIIKFFICSVYVCCGMNRPIPLPLVVFNNSHSPIIYWLYSGSAQIRYDMSSFTANSRAQCLSKDSSKTSKIHKTYWNFIGYFFENQFPCNIPCHPQDLGNVW